MNKKEIEEYKLNFFLKLIKRIYLNRLSLENINRYDRLPEKLKYDGEIISKVIELDKRKVNSIPESYLINIIERTPDIINELTDTSKIINIINFDPKLLRYVDGKDLEETLFSYYGENIESIINYNDIESVIEIINKNFPNIEHKIKALTLVTSELNKEENEYMDERYYYNEDYDDYIENETRGEIFYELFMNVYSQLPENDINLNMEMINIWKSVDDWKNNLEMGGYEWQGVKDDFYNIVKKLAGKDLEKRIKALELYGKDFDGEQIAKFLNELTEDIENASDFAIEDLDTVKSNVIESYFEKLNESGDILWSIEAISDNKTKLQLLKKYCDLFGEQVEEETMSMMTRIFYEEYVIKMREDSEQAKLEMFEAYYDYIDEYYDPINSILEEGNKIYHKKSEFGDLLETLYRKKEDEDKKVNLLRENSERLNNSTIAKIISSFSYKEYDEEHRGIYSISNDSLKLQLLKEYENKLNGSSISIVIKSINDYSVQLQLLNDYENRFNKTQLAEIIAGLNCEGSEKINLVKKHKDKLKDDKKYHEAFTDRTEDFSELLSNILVYMKDDEKNEALNEFKGEMNQNDIMHVVMSVIDKEARRKLFSQYGFDNIYNYELVERCFENFGVQAFTISSNMNVISKEFVNIVGEKLSYSFVKYILDGENNKAINIEEITSNPELFKNYMEFRQKCMQKGKQKSLELDKVISEYERNKELFAEFSRLESNTEQDSIMQAIIRDGIHNKIEGQSFDYDGNMFLFRSPLINNIEELPEYAYKRKEYFETQINDESQDIPYEIILGISAEEYNNLKGKFKQLITDDSQTFLSNTFQNIMTKLPEEKQANMANVIAGIKLIEKYEAITEPSERKKFLLMCNEELSLQFKDSNSIISKIRNSMPYVEDELRDHFGKEISNSLYFKSENEEVEEISGVKVIHMKGGDFQCLIHAVDAYVTGNGHYEKRERGNSYLCTSLISSKFMGRAQGKPIVAFSKMKSQAFIQEGAEDISVHHNEGKNNFDYRASNIGYMTDEELLEETVLNNELYNEVDWYREYENDDGLIEYLIPDVVICFNEIDEESIEEAKHIQEEFGLEKPPTIRVIHEECYIEKIEEFRNQVMEKYSQRSKTKDKNLSEKVEMMLKEMIEYASPEVTNNVLQAIINAEKEKAQGMEEK